MSMNEERFTDITKACRRFYEVFDHYPSKIGVHPCNEFTKAGIHLGIDRVFVPYVTSERCNYNDFNLYSETVGLIYPDELTMSVDLIQTMIKIKGYQTALCFDNAKPVKQDPDKFAEPAPKLYTLFIFSQKHDFHVRFSFTDDFFNQQLDQIKITMGFWLWLQEFTQPKKS